MLCEWFAKHEAFPELGIGNESTVMAGHEDHRHGAATQDFTHGRNTAIAVAQLHICDDEIRTASVAPGRAMPRA
jgi:hypothetical protein